MNPNSRAANSESLANGEQSAETEVLPPLPNVHCQECGYDLRGLTSNRCPECGRSLESLRSPIPQIPWIHHKDLGSFRAFWATVRMATFQCKRLCEEVVRPVGYADAQRFRWMTVLHAYVPILIGTATLYVAVSQDSCSTRILKDGAVRAVVLAGWPLAAANVGALLFLAAATGIPSYFFHPRGVPLQQQNRAVALSYYACAPLVATVVPVGAALLVPWTTAPDMMLLRVTVAILLQALVVVAWASNLMSMCRRVIPQRKGRSLLVGLTFPLLFLTLGITCVVGVPLVAFYVYLIYSSLR